MNRNLTTFGDIEMDAVIKSVHPDHFLVRLNKIINWSRISEMLSITDYRKNNIAGRDCFSPLLMFKIMLLLKLTTTSDRYIEDRLKTDMLYMWFCGLSISSVKPDHSTICRWRNRFKDFDIFEKALDEINYQLQKQGLVLTDGVIVDGTLQRSKATPKNETFIEEQPTGDATPDEPKVDVSQFNYKVIKKTSADPDGAWVKRGKKSVYGYNVMTGTSLEGYVLDMITTPANVPDVTNFPKIIEKINPAKYTGVYGDKGHDSKDNRKILQEKDLLDYLMIKHKTNENQEIKDVISLINKGIAKTRYAIERTFGGLKNKLGFRQSRYFGIEKTHNSNILGACVYNLIRAVNSYRIIAS